jgi:hypothetical protein
MERGRSEVIASVDDPDEQLGAGSARLTAPALAGLDEVPWAALHHAYGPADDVPGDLRALRSPDPAIRHGAHASLRGSVYHQGTRWQASAYTVPFLIALVDAVELRETMVDLPWSRSLLGFASLGLQRIGLG